MSVDENEKTVRGAEDAALAILQKYEAYTDHMRALERKTTMLDTLKGWIMGGSVASRDKANQTFYQEVEVLVRELCAALETAETETASRSSAQAARVILAPRPVKSTSASDWMLTAAQGHAIALIPYLEREVLQQLRDEYRKAYPKRMMLPKQREVLAAMERRLESMQ